MHSIHVIDLKAAIGNYRERKVCAALERAPTAKFAAGEDRTGARAESRSVYPIEKRTNNQRNTRVLHFVQDDVIF
jgi:hypothetical protein